MKLKAKILTLVLVLATLISIIGVFAIPASAATITAGTKLYMKPGSNWRQSTPRFAAYFYGNGDAWVDMTDVDGDGVYECTSPNKSYSNVIFVRFSSSNSTNSFDSKWNQTSDLTYDGTKNLYTVADSAWDKGSGSWSTYTPPTLYLKGLFGDWGNTRPLVNDGTALKTTVNLQKGTYEFKINSTTGTWWGKNSTTINDTVSNLALSTDGSAANVNLNVSKCGAYTFSFNSGKLTVTRADDDSAHTGGAATCTTKATCSACGQSYGSLAEHSYTAETVKDSALKSAADCTSGAVYYKSCSACGLVSTKETDTFVSGDPVHNYSWTSLNDNQHEGTCACGATTTEAHSFENRVCTKCEVEQACAHEFSEVTYTWTESNGGYKCNASGVCTAGCEKTITEEVVASITASEPAKCTSAGSKTYTATFNTDGFSTDTKIVSVDATGHSFGDTTEANAATCLAAGNDAYKQCTVCNLYFAGAADENSTEGKADTTSFVIAKKAHTLNSRYECSECENRIVYVKNTGWANVNCYTWSTVGDLVGWPGAAMTDEGDGLWSYLIPISKNCTNVIFNNGSVQTGDLDLPTNCKVVYNKSAGGWETAGHIFDLEVMTQDTLKDEATCNSYAVYYKSCSCGAVSNSDEYTFEDIEGGYSTNHVAPIGTACGSDFVCTICLNPIKGNHANVVTDAAVDPTCTETGLTEGSHCAACDTVIVAQEVVDALGHTKGADATCTTNQICTVCKVELKAALGHNFVNGNCDRCDCIKVFFKPGSDWAADNAWFAVYHFSVGNAWEKMTLENGVYTAIVPEGDTIIFCRMNPAFDVLGWDDGDDRVWNQTVDIAPGNNCFIIDNPWDSSKEYKATVKADAHEVTTWSPINETTHSGACTVCGETVVGDHSYTGDWQIGADNHWKDCDSCGYDGHAGEHNYTGDVQKDGTYHWQTCSCGDTNKVEHNYNKTVATETYKATDATCTSPASYYCSCECGAKGTSTFTSGVIADHVFVTHDAVAATCQAAGNAVYYTCENCSNYFTSNADPKTSGVSFESFKGLEDYYFPKLDHDYSGAIKDDGNGKHSFKCVNGCNEYGNAAAHDYDKKVAEDTYKKTDATCTAKATYYYSCECGAKGTNTFESGEMLDHIYDRQVTTETYKVSDATCTAKATYYYSCECGAKGTNTFEFGEKLGHNYENATPFYRVEDGVVYSVKQCERYGQNGCTGEEKTELSDMVEVSNEADLRVALYAGYSVKLTADIDLNAGCINLDTAGHDITIDLNGHRLVNNNVRVNEVVDVLWVKAALTVTITDSATDGAMQALGTAAGKTTCVISATDGAIINIESGSFYSEGCTTIYATRGGKINISGGHYEAADSSFLIDINEGEANENYGTIVITGGKFVDFNPANHTNDKPVSTNKIPDGYHTIESEGVYTVDEHHYVAGTPVPVTCTTDGYTLYTCACGDDYMADTVSASGHSFGEVVPKVDATCTEDGREAYVYCSKCETYFFVSVLDKENGGKYENCGVKDSAFESTFKIDAEGHVFTIHSYNAPTCTEAGNEAHKKCTVCNLYFDTEATKDATDGSENNNEYIINALGHKDENTDHVCDNNCGVAQGDHVDADKDHACDYGCSVAIGDHVDTNKDHACDYGCSEAIGEHKDSATDDNHVCDYGCDEVLEECSDVTGDGNHNCDVCGTADVTGHSYDNPTCTESSTCTECGATSGDPMGHDFSEGIECKNGCGSKAVASIDGKYYLTLQQAFDAVENGETIVLARDFELSATAVAPAVKFTIDLNGKTVTSADDYALNSDNQSIICVTRGTDLTINDSIGGGCLDASELYIAINLTKNGEPENGECASLTVNAGKYMGGWYAIAGNGSRDNTRFILNGGTLIGVGYDGIYHPQQGELIINGGTIEGNGGGVYVRSSYVEVNGGTIIGNNDCAFGVEFMNSDGYGNVDAKINGGTFITRSSEPVVYSIAPDGEERLISFISGGTFNTDFDLALLVDGLALKQDGESYNVVNAVAKIDRTGYGYASLADAVAAAQANDEINLLANDTVANTLNIGKSLTINTGAFAITSKADVAFNITAASVSFKLVGNVIMADPAMAQNARSGGVAVAQTVLTMDDVADVTAILDAEFELGAGDVIYSGPVDNISLSVRAAYAGALNKKGYVTKDSTTPGMVDVTAKSLYYIGDDGYWYFDDVKTGVLAKGENGESITITSYDKQPVKDGEFVVSHNYVITFSDGSKVTINVPVARSIVNVEYNRTEGNKDIYVITYSDGSTSEFTVTNGTDGHSPVITIENGEWCIDGTPTGIKALGKDGKGIKSINKTTDGLVDTYTIIYTDDTEFKFTVTNGRGIVSISLTSTSADGLVDTYTITYNDGTTSTFTVTNGANGINGIQGEKGDDGHTPVITIQNGKWHIDGVDTGMQAQGVKGETGNGISDISKTGIDGLVDTYTITYTDGTKTTFTVTNGAQGAQGIQGIQGVPGKDGHTPVITIGDNGNWFIDGADTGVKAEAIKGETGAPGADGEDGDTPYIGENGNWWIDGVDTGVKAEGKDGNDNNKIIILCIGIAALCIITTIVAVATKKFRRPWWILC